MTDAMQLRYRLTEVPRQGGHYGEEQWSTYEMREHPAGEYVRFVEHDCRCPTCGLEDRRYYRDTIDRLKVLEAAAVPAPPSDWLNVIHAIGVDAMSAQSDPYADAQVYRKALIGICNMALKAQDSLRAAVPVSKQTNGASLIAAERARQVSIEGWTPEHDAAHVNAELSNAAIAYVFAGNRAMDAQAIGLPYYWPWEQSWWKPSDDPVRNFVKAGALIAAEIDRLERTK